MSFICEEEFKKLKKTKEFKMPQKKNRNTSHVLLSKA